MNRRLMVGGIGLVATLVVVFGGLGIAIHFQHGQDEARLDEQLRLARQEGLPPTWQDFAATIRPAKPSENAAPYYERLTNLKTRGSDDPGRLSSELALHPSVANLAKAKRFLAQNSDALSLLDQAAALPRCWFNRDWSLGAAVLFRELAPMKFGCKLLALRGCVAAQEGSPSDAIRSFNQAERMGIDVGEEGTELGTLVDIAVFAIVGHAIALLEYAHPEAPAYRQAAARLMRDWPQPDAKYIHREELFFLLTIIDLSLTEKGLAKLGLNPQDVPKSLTILQSLANQTKARTRIVEAERRVWESYGYPLAQRRPKMEQAKADVKEAMGSLPVAADIYYKLSGDDGQVDTIAEFISGRRLEYVALFRALSNGRAPKTLDTSDLRSPFDGKPLEYKFDGAQITITVSTPGEDKDRRLLKFPSDEALGRKAPH